ncbi:hypothetical protein DFP72DRAFT_915563 [Ephemerocybe angulata]|uniref:Uncharacterized protein n=1 Tax=Ephemerocybe angulata TaxID=980116 RepID=A0A8H6HLW3_9AGAR|nr:hypothetical protein DFP72DRAFT_915563 [Tulosesus angulatus]
MSDSHSTQEFTTSSAPAHPSTSRNEARGRLVDNHRRDLPLSLLLCFVSLILSAPFSLHTFFVTPPLAVFTFCFSWLSYERLKPDHARQNREDTPPRPSSQPISAGEETAPLLGTPQARGILPRGLPGDTGHPRLIPESYIVIASTLSLFWLLTGFTAFATATLQLIGKLEHARWGYPMPLGSPYIALGEATFDILQGWLMYTVATNWKKSNFEDILNGSEGAVTVLDA